MNMYQEAELRVLRHLKDDPDDLIPEGMEEFEFNTACDNLMARDCIWVAWSEGHHAEAVIVRDRGLMRLKELERLAKGEEEENTRLRRENGELTFQLSQSQAQFAQLQEQLAQLQAKIEEMTVSANGFNKYETIRELRNIFKGSDEEAEKFLNRIQGQKAKDITAAVNEYLKGNKLSTDGSSKNFYDILSKYGLYDKSYQNWNTQVNWPN